MVQLRQLILNLKSEFTNNTSWRFIDANYIFQTDKPASESFTETISVEDLSNDTEMRFIAVKIGDMNDNAIANSGSSFEGSESRNTTKTLTFTTEDQGFKSGEIFTADLNLTELESIAGYQFTLDLKPDLIEILKIEEGITKSTNFGTHLMKDGKLTTSWHQEAHLVEDEQRMFSLVLRAKQKGKLSQAINIGSELTQAEAYNQKGALLNVDLKFIETTNNLNNFTLFNNKPNPFNQLTVIGFELPESSPVRLSIFDFSGKIVHKVSGDFDKGYHEIQLERSSLDGSGIYFYQLETATNIAKKKMIHIEN